MVKAKNLSAEAFKAAHELASDLCELGFIDAKKMREYDKFCLPPLRPFSAAMIKRLRLRSRLSQVVFAAALNTSPSTVRQWEQGLKQPSGTSLKLLNLVATRGVEVLF